MSNRPSTQPCSPPRPASVTACTPPPCRLFIVVSLATPGGVCAGGVRDSNVGGHRVGSTLDCGPHARNRAFEARASAGPQDREVVGGRRSARASGSSDRELVALPALPRVRPLVALSVSARLCCPSRAAARGEGGERGAGCDGRAGTASLWTIPPH